MGGNSDLHLTALMLEKIARSDASVVESIDFAKSTRIRYAAAKAQECSTDTQIADDISY